MKFKRSHDIKWLRNTFEDIWGIEKHTHKNRDCVHAIDDSLSLLLKNKFPSQPVIRWGTVGERGAQSAAYGCDEAA